jgi:hypothetical protein
MFSARIILIIILVIMPVVGPEKTIDSRPMSELIIKNLGNGDQNVGDSEISGWKFTIIGPDNSQTTVTTDENGVARVILPPGDYIVRDETILKEPKMTVSLAPNEKTTIVIANARAIESRKMKQNELNYVGYPQISLIPESLNFTESENGQRIDMTVYCPNYCNIYEANIKLEIPKDWTIIPNTESTPIYYLTKENTFWIYNFGNYKENYTSDWFRIKPNYNIQPGLYFLKAEVVADYVHADHEGTISPMHENKTSKIIKLFFIETNNNWLDLIKNNLGLLIAIIVLLFGNGIIYKYREIKEKLIKLTK